MDDKQKEQATTGGLGMGVGFLLGGPAGAAVGGVLGGIVGGYEKKHEKITREAFYMLADQTSASAKLYVDHIDPDGAEDGNTTGVVKGVEGKPDIIVSDPPTKNLIIEAETWKGIQDDQQHVLKQLEDFRARGYQRILVVPEKEIEQILEWVNEKEEVGEINGPELMVASARRLEGFLN